VERERSVRVCLRSAGNSQRTIADVVDFLVKQTVHKLWTIELSPLNGDVTISKEGLGWADHRQRLASSSIAATKRRVQAYGSTSPSSLCDLDGGGNKARSLSAKLAIMSAGFDSLHPLSRGAVILKEVKDLAHDD
jgi:hypothetical protein